MKFMLIFNQLLCYKGVLYIYLYQGGEIFYCKKIW